MRKEIKVAPIKNGTVIDHITAGEALKVFRILRIESPTKQVISMTMNTRSKTMKRKDIIMIENKELSLEETNKITLIAPQATINIIENSEVIAKDIVELPKIIEGIIRCANSNCISNAEKEPITSKFIAKDTKFRCVYCGQIIEDAADFIQ